MDYEKEIPFGAFDSELMHQEITIPEGFEATIDGDKIILTRIENEDERIRKSLIILLQHFCKGYRVPGLDFPVSYKDMLDWLEKQGEQKPVDNVGSKFKVEEGKWYVCTQTFVLRGKIVIIKGQTYQAEKDNVIKGENGCRFIDRHDGKASDYFRSWTIQDAKDGDVLYFNNDISGFHSIGLFKRLASKNEINGGTYRCYARYGGFNEESKLEIAQNNNELHHFGTKAYPATKEQRDLLFQKMKEAGYEWDAETKELKSLISNGGDFDSKNCEQKSAWGEEDDWMKTKIIKVLLGCETFLTPEETNECIDWLKSLKERYFWKPSKEQMHAFEQVYDWYNNNFAPSETLTSLYNDLKKLKVE